MEQNRNQDQGRLGDADVARSHTPPSGGSQEPTGSDAKRVADQAKDQAKSAADEAQRQAHGARERLSQGAHTIKDQAKQQASQLTEQAKAQAQAYVDQGKSRAAEQVESVSSAFRSVGDQLREHQAGMIACYADTAADQVDRVSSYLRERDMWGMLDDARGVARRRPELVIGGMFIAGLAVARFLKASKEHRADRYETDYTRGDAAGRTYGAAGSYGERRYQAESRYGESNIDTAAARTGPVGAVRAFESRGTTSVTTSNPTGATPSTTPGTSPAVPRTTDPDAANRPNPLNP